MAFHKYGKRIAQLGRRKKGGASLQSLAAYL
jgi:hypothetical protein